MRKYLLLIIFSILPLVLAAASISGYVTDRANGEPISYTSVFIKGTNIGAYTNPKGYFVLNNVPSGKISLVFSIIGYKKNQRELNIKNKYDDKFIRIELEKAAVAIQGITVSENKYYDIDDINTKDIRVSRIRRTTQDLLDVPQIADADVFRSLQTLPGVSSMSDFSSGLYIRGGSQDQNLILLDNIDVYNPTHFGGVFSTFNTDAIESVELIKGGFPSKYGGRLSSVMNVINREGNRKKFEGVSRTSLISSSATLEGPWELGQESGSYMMSFRRTYLELIKKMISMNMPDYYFYDGHCKVNWDINKKDRLTNSFYFGRDKLNLDMGSDLEIYWGNKTFTSQWVHIFNPQLFSQFIVAGSYFGSFLGIKSDGGEEFDRVNDLYDLSLKGLLNYKPNDNHMIDFGYEAKYNDISYYIETKNTDIDESNFPDVQVGSGTFSLYASDSWDLNPFWTLEPGLRLSYYKSLRNNLEASPDASYLRFSPRFSIRYKIGLLSNFYASYGRYHQFLTSLNMGISSPMDLWFPLDGSVEPGESNHYIFGFKTQIMEALSLDIETYYKTYDNLLEYRIETDNEWSNEEGKLADIYNMGDGYSYGFDFLLRNNWQGIKGFLGYGFCRTLRKIDNVNLNPETGEEEEFHPRYDRTHQINIVETWNLSEIFDRKFRGAELRIGSTYSFATGQPYYKPEKTYVDGGADPSQDFSFGFLNSYRDSYRLANYSRFDLSVKFKWTFSKWSIEPYLQIINLFNHRNVWSVDYSYKEDEDGNFYLEEYKSNMFPRIPFIGFNIEW